MYPVDPVHVLYDFHYYKLNFMGALICLFGCSGIFVTSLWISILL